MKLRSRQTEFFARVSGQTVRKRYPCSFLENRIGYLALAVIKVGHLVDTVHGTTSWHLPTTTPTQRRRSPNPRKEERTMDGRRKHRPCLTPIRRNVSRYTNCSTPPLTHNDTPRSSRFVFFPRKSGIRAHSTCAASQRACLTTRLVPYSKLLVIDYLFGVFFSNLITFIS